jgi:hypothetical protein
MMVEKWVKVARDEWIEFSDRIKKGEIVDVEFRYWDDAEQYPWQVQFRDTRKKRWRMQAIGYEAEGIIVEELDIRENERD